jgi:hypothetical protein
MNDTCEKQIAELEAKLVLLITEIRQTPLYPRVELWIERMTGGKKLSAYLRDDTTPVRDKLAMVRALVDILLGKDYGRLPVAEPVAPAPECVAPACDEEPDLPDSVFTPEQVEAIDRAVRHELGKTLGILARALGKT